MVSATSASTLTSKVAKVAFLEACDILQVTSVTLFAVKALDMPEAQLALCHLQLTR